MKDKYLKIRIDEDRLAKLKEIADYDEMSVSAWIRESIDLSYEAFNSWNHKHSHEKGQPYENVPTKPTHIDENVPTNNVATKDNNPKSSLNDTNVPTDVLTQNDTTIDNTTKESQPARQENPFGSVLGNSLTAIAQRNKMEPNEGLKVLTIQVPVEPDGG